MGQDDRGTFRLSPHSPKILRAAIEAAKQANAFEGNPDVWIDISNGNLFLEEEEGYEFLDNVDYYLP